jgi:sulfopyruvate decarboxylase subunit alpha
VLTPTEQLYERLKAEKIDFFVSVPCKLLAELIERLEEDPDITYTPVTREEEGVGILAGAYMAGKRPALVMQNSGFGNAVNAVCSLLTYFKIPVVFLTSHRGSEGEPVETQRVMGDAIKPLMEVVGVDCIEVGSTADLDRVGEGIARAFETHKPVGFLFPFSFWQGDE